MDGRGYERREKCDSLHEGSHWARLASPKLILLPFPLRDVLVAHAPLFLLISMDVGDQTVSPGEKAGSRR